MNFLAYPLSHIHIVAGLCDSFKQENSSTPSACGLPTVGAGSSELQQVLTIAFGVLGALAVLFIVMGGLRMVTSQGNPQEMGKARATVIYALVGLVVALLAEAFVAFVLGHLS
jgi:Type IV secretion system pilin